MPNKILLAIDDIKEATRSRGYDPEQVFTKGECGSLFILLYELFPGEVKPYGIYPIIHENGKSWICRDANHILTQHEGILYDVKGEFKEEVDETTEVLKECHTYYEPYCATDHYQNHEVRWNARIEIPKIAEILSEKGHKFPFGIEESKKQIVDFIWGRKSMCDNMRVVEEKKG